MGFSGDSTAAGNPGLSAAIDIDAVLNQIAQPSQPQVVYARERIAELPVQLKEAAKIPFSARAVIWGLLLDPEQQLRNKQLALLNKHLSSVEINDLTPIMMSSAGLDAGLRLPLIELCLSPLKQLSTDQQHNFVNGLHLLITADNNVSLMEWALYRIALHNTIVHNKPTRHRNLRDMQNECRQLLSLLAYAGTADDESAKAAFAQAVAILPVPAEAILPRADIKLANANEALEQLNLTKPLQKPQLLKALSQCILHDGQITITEAELFRAIADSLDCPIPPLITGMNQ